MQMPTYRIPMAVCAAIAGVFSGSHKRLEAKFRAAGVTVPPPELPHDEKWKVWISMIGDDPNVDSLSILGNLVEEYMDVEPAGSPEEVIAAREGRQRLASILEDNGLTYFRGGRVLPNGQTPLRTVAAPGAGTQPVDACNPSSVENVLQTLIRGLPRAMHPLAKRRKGLQALTFQSEYDVQDLLHALIRPWVADIRPEEYTPSYAGTSTRMDFLLPKYSLVLELKLIRDVAHGRKIGDELIIDFEHYRRHPKCTTLWCVIYDPNHHIGNLGGLISDLDGQRTTPDGSVDVRVFVLPQ
jgi:hypothetical protein